MAVVMLSSPVDAIEARSRLRLIPPAGIAIRRQRLPRTWLLGDALSIADFAVAIAIALPYAEAAHIPLAVFAHVARWHETADGAAGVV